MSILPASAPSGHVPIRRRAWLSAFVAVVGLVAGARQGLADLPAADVWIVSTRRLPGVCAVPTAPPLAVERHSAADGCGRWERSDLATLLATPDQPLLVFIHGNRYDVADARAHGLRLARTVAAVCPDRGPARTVIFSWPSEQQGVLLKDGRAKYARAHADAHYLTWFLGQVEPTRPVAIVGYSFGAIITLEALDELAALERAGRADLQPWLERPARTHVVLVAPAVRCDAVSPRGPCREAVECIDRLQVINNTADDALKFFPWLDPDVGLPALGYVGMRREWMPPWVEYSAVDAARIVGKRHGLPLYLDSPTLSRTIAEAAASGL